MGMSVDESNSKWYLHVDADIFPVVVLGYKGLFKLLPYSMRPTLGYMEVNKVQWKSRFGKLWASYSSSRNFGPQKQWYEEITGSFEVIITINQHLASSETHWSWIMGMKKSLILNFGHLLTINNS